MEPEEEDSRSRVAMVNTMEAIALGFWGVGLQP